MQRFQEGTRRQQIVLIAFAICSALVIYSAIVITRGQVRVSRDEIETSIKTKLPIGMPRVMVVKWLEESQFEFSADGTKPRELYGLIRNSRGGVYGTCNLQVNFAFDERGQLQRYSTGEACTSL